MSGHSFVNLSNVRNDEQASVMEEIDKAGHCPFCTENLKRYHKKPILHEGEHWLVTENQWPYDSTKFHFLLISKKHIEKLADLEPAAASEYWEMNKWIEEKWGVTGGAVAMRFGESGSNGSSVRHLHSHLIVPDEILAKEKPVRFKVSG